MPTSHSKLPIDAVWRHIDAQRADLADVLAGFDTAQWEHPSLCDGWRVRDVAAHLTLATATFGEVLPWLLRTRSFPGMVRESAIHLDATTDDIVARLRAMVGGRATAPFVTPAEPLLDVLIHGQDICLPLGIDRPMPPDAAAASISRVLTLNRRPVVRLTRLPRRIRLIATDTDWSWGTGPEIRGELRWLLLAAAGRPAALEFLSGPTELLRH